MNVKKLLTSLSLIAVSQFSLSACVERECTEEEREAAGADDNDDCTRFVPLEVYPADDSERESIDWSSGEDVLITGDIRGVNVVAGDDDDKVVVEWTAEAELAQGREQDVVDATLAKLEVSLTSSGGQVTFRGDRQDTSADLGAAITLELPQGFDGRLRINKTNSRGGDVRIRYLGDSPHLEVDMNEPLADLDIADVSSLETVLINTQDDITMSSAFGENLVTAVLHSGSGDIEADFSAAPRSHARIVSDFAGDISVDLPNDDFTLTAEADGFGDISFNGTPSGCNVRRDGEQFAAMLCNDGDADGLTFEIVSDGDISINF